MPKIKGPNGLVFTFSDDIAEALLLNKGEYELVKPKTEPKTAEASK